ncbi:MAG: hypothetical protein IPK27_11985 [Rhodanobacteraceae bacterium]|nr:hypothetical protein [Rhodanobacteraceae bacterium]
MRNRVLTAALLAALSAPAFAQDAEEEESGPFSFNIGVVSDYAFRGVSQTNEGPAFQGGIDYAHDSGFYAGVWASNVDFVDGDGANAEIDFIVGWSTEFTDTIAFDVSLLRYAYHDQSAYEYNELIFNLGVGDYLGFQLAYSNDVFNSDETGIYYQVNGSYPLPWWELTLGGSLGHYDLDDALGDSYQDYSIGLSKPFGPMTVGLQWVHATDDIDWGDNGGSRTLLTAVWEF